MPYSRHVAAGRRYPALPQSTPTSPIDASHAEDGLELEAQRSIIQPEPTMQSSFRARTSKPRATLGSLVQQTASKISVPAGWSRQVHPKGWIYYYHAERRLVTDFTLEFAMGQQQFENALKQHNVDPSSVSYPDGCEVWVDQRFEVGQIVPDMLFVDHINRHITPLGYEELKPPALGEDGTWTEEYLKMNERPQYEENYWGYINTHPSHVTLPAAATEDAIAALVWYTEDRMLNPEESAVPFSKDMSHELLELLLTMQENDQTFGSDRNRGVKNHFVACLLERVANERVRQHYGSQDARKQIRKEMLADAKRSSKLGIPFLSFLLDMFMTFVCFGAPFAYLRQINEFFVSEVGRTDTIEERWQSFVDVNVADWTNTNLVSTVLLSASVALLAVPGIDKASRILVFASTFCSIASLITGLLNVWQHQHNSKTNFELRIVFHFFYTAERIVKTDKLLAVLLSLPMVLLIWATLVFAASMVNFAWNGLDTTFVGAGNFGRPNDGTDSTGAESFGHPTAWLATGLLSLMIALVLTSVLYFSRAWKPKPKASKKDRRLPMRFLSS